MSKKWLNFLAFGVMFIINILATMGKINRATPGRISDEYPLTFTPAGYAFSIWSLIYLLMLVFFIWSLSDEHKFAKAAVHQSYTFIISCMFNIAWIFAWHYRVTWLSWLFIAGLLVSLIVLNQEILNASSHDKSCLHRCLEIYPFQVYYGWIIVATIANTAILLYRIIGNTHVFLGISGEIWTVILIIVAFLLTWYISFVKHIKPVGWVFSWAVIAIAVKNYQWKAAGVDYMQFASKGQILIVIVAFLAAFIMMKSYLDNCSCCSEEVLSAENTTKKDKKSPVKAKRK